MEIKIGFNHINNLKDFGNQIPKEFKSFNVKVSEDSDYRLDAIRIAQEIRPEFENFKGQWELVTQVGNRVSITPFTKDDLVGNGKFTALQENDPAPNMVCEIIYDSILDGFGIKSKYL
jgi:hypothetical protein